MKRFLLAASFFVAVSAVGQTKAPENWPTLDPISDKVYGVGAEQAYKTLNGEKSKKVIVAVIDSGVDIEHEDLKEVIWTNPGEIPDNGIDDDKNGYVDDVHGWSFLGGKNGDINYEATELARLYQKGKRKYSEVDTTALKREDLKAFEEYKGIRSTFLHEQAEYENQLKGLAMVNDFLNKVKSKNGGVLTKDGLKNYVPENEMEERLQKGLKLALMLGMDVKELETQIGQGTSMIGNLVKYNKLNVDSIRAAVVGDDVNNPNERYYGCNRVKGPDALHGTHVAGIIAAVRNNNVGIKGIADNVIIMPVRAVPSGDERDKDVANAIRYAVDNGATIINMSFGKYYSPEKNVVDEAVEYAQSKDVLLIHAAGNDSKNNDLEMPFPSRDLLNGKTADNWIQVGASAYKKGKDIIGSFSNYGPAKVDLFAPGVDVYSCVPDNNKYLNESGTSMASPSTAGVAAIVRGYFPELKAQDVKAVMMKTVVPYKKKVIIPGTKKKKTKVKDLCISGGFVNANNAVLELMKVGK